MKKKLLFLAVMAIFCYRGLAQVNIEVVSNFLQCNNEVFDLTMHNPVVVANMPPGDYTVTYFASLDDFISNTAIINPDNYIMPSGAIEQWIYAKVLNNANNGYMAIVFRIGFWESTPLFDYASGCESYVLAPLQEGIQYYTGPAGTGNMLYAGDVITESMTVYPFQSGIECTNSVGIPINVNHVPEIVPGPVVGCETMPAHGVSTLGHSLIP